MIEITPSQVYTIREIAEYLKCSTRKIHRLIARGELKGFKIGNQRRFKGEEILQYIEIQGGEGGLSASMASNAVQAERLYSLREAAAILGVTSSDVSHLLRTGQLAGFRVGMDWRCWGHDLIRLAGITPAASPEPAAETPYVMQLAPLSPAPRAAVPAAEMLVEAAD